MRMKAVKYGVVLHTCMRLWHNSLSLSVWTVRKHNFWYFDSRSLFKILKKSLRKLKYYQKTKKHRKYINKIIFIYYIFFQKKHTPVTTFCSDSEFQFFFFERFRDYTGKHCYITWTFWYIFFIYNYFLSMPTSLCLCDTQISLPTL